MPIRSNQRGYLAEPLTELLLPTEVQALSLLRTSLHLDLTQTYRFWEAVVARLVAGSLTADACPWDVVLQYGAEDIRIEVKYAREMWCQFTNGRRAVLKFASPKGAHSEKPAHVIVLVGIDELCDVYSWAIPAAELRKHASITVTSPRFRRSQSCTRGFDEFRVPAGQLLPEILRMYHRHVNAQTRSERVATEKAVWMQPLFAAPLTNTP